MSIVKDTASSLELVQDHSRSRPVTYGEKRNKIYDDILIYNVDNYAFSIYICACAILTSFLVTLFFQGIIRIAFIECFRIEKVYWYIRWCEDIMTSGILATKLQTKTAKLENQPVTSVPTSLFHEDGSIRKTTKAELLHKLEDFGAGVRILPKLEVSATIYIRDAMAVLQMMPGDKHTSFNSLQIFIWKLFFVVSEKLTLLLMCLTNMIM